MASSSRTKKQRSSVSQSKQGTSSMESNPLNLTRLLANNEQRKVFEDHFHGRTIFTPKFGNVGNFEFEDFLFHYLLRQQNIFDFCCESTDIYPELVRVFYCNMNFRKNHLTSIVKGKDISLDAKTFSSLCCNIPFQGSTTGFDLVCEWDNCNTLDVHMAERGRGTSQNVPNDLLEQMVEVLQGMNKNLQKLNRGVALGLNLHTLVSQGPAEYRELDKSCRRNPGQFQGRFAPNAAIEWVQGMKCTNMKANGVVTSKSIPPKNFGPQRNFLHGRGKDKMFHEERKPYFPTIGIRGYTSHGSKTLANVGGCFRCKETGHIKRYCPMSRQSMNAMGTGRPQSIGRMVTMCGVEASEAEGLTQCRMYEEKGNESQRSYGLTGVHRNHAYQRSKPTVEVFQPDVFTMCSKCGGCMRE
ncbi:hypothetical protein Lal_00042503 [Lupinus albus]|nr:hypothetical protein Lal_00042503 [Lupinus albus]